MRIILLVMCDGAGRRYNVGAVAGDAQPVDGGDPADLMDLVARTGALTVHEVRAVADANPVGFGRRNPHCSNCGDERGGPFGHEISECLYERGMTVPEVRP